LEFYLRHGASGVAQVRRAAPECGLFLDLKLHDIPATVAGGARAVAALAPDFLTVHASGGATMVGAAAEALPNTRIAAVTLLTSLAPTDLLALRLPPADELVVQWAHVAVTAGARALVSSALEVAALRVEFPGDVRLITPGIRPAGGQAQDQSRVATPQAAVGWGSDVLVVGRPITAAAAPAAAAAAIAAEIRAAS
jgi:orotidine-5'-phosphate decarboxylase